MDVKSFITTGPGQCRGLQDIPSNFKLVYKVTKCYQIQYYTAKRVIAQAQGDKSKFIKYTKQNKIRIVKSLFQQMFLKLEDFSNTYCHHSEGKGALPSVMHRNLSLVI
jgi:hypothetical protein